MFSIKRNTSLISGLFLIVIILAVLITIWSDAIINFFASDPLYLWLLPFVIVLFKLGYEFRKGRIYTPFFTISLTYIVFIVIGVAFLDLLRGIPPMTEYLPVVTLAYLLFLLGIYFARLRLTSTVKRPGKNFLSDLSKQHRRQLLGIAAVAVLMAGLLFVRAGAIPLFSSNVNESRINALLGGGYLQIWIYALPVIALFFGIYYLEKKSIGYLYLFCVLSIIILVVFLGMAYRSNVVKFILEVAILYFVIRKQKLSLWLIPIGIVGLFIFLSIFGAYRRGGDTDLMTSTVKEFTIILTSRPVMFRLIAENFTDFYYGESLFSDLMKLLPGTQVGRNVELKYLLFPNAELLPANSGVNPSILGEFFINFGYPGVYIGMFLFGWLLQKLYLAIIKNPKPRNLVLYSMLIMEMVNAVLSGINTRLPILVMILFWIPVVDFLTKWQLRFIGPDPGTQEPVQSSSASDA